MFEWWRSGRGGDSMGWICCGMVCVWACGGIFAVLLFGRVFTGSVFGAIVLVRC